MTINELIINPRFPPLSRVFGIFFFKNENESRFMRRWLFGSFPRQCNNLEQGGDGFSDSDWFLCFLFTTKRHRCCNASIAFLYKCEVVYPIQQAQLTQIVSYPAPTVYPIQHTHPQYAHFIWAKQAKLMENTSVLKNVNNAPINANAFIVMSIYLFVAFFAFLQRGNYAMKGI